MNLITRKLPQSQITDNITDYLFITAGTIAQAIGMVFFLIPARLTSGGVSGLAQVVHHYTGWPIGFMTLVGNIPLLLLGYQYLGRRRFAARTIYAVATFSLFTDLISYFVSAGTITDDIILNTLFGSVLLGLGCGLVYKGGGTSGGSDIIGRILNQHFGISITQSYIMVDLLTVLAGAFAFGWDLGLYGMIAIYISGVAAETVSEGSAVFREAIIITNQPQALSQSIIETLEHGVTHIDCIGGYSGEMKHLVYCVVNRSEVNILKRLVVETDPASFMVVGHAHEVLGEGFQKYKTLN